MKLLFLGPPGAGKGTQAIRIADRLGVPHIATGNMLREAVAAGTELGLVAEEVMARGDLVSDDLVIAMLEERIARADAATGFILDGFPRTITQGEALATRMGESGLDGAVYIAVNDDEIVRRISGRRTCPNQHVYHVDDNAPTSPGICDIDGELLIQRDDDAESVVRNRLEVYREQTQPLVAFYTDRGLRIHSVEGVGDMHDIESAICTALDIS